MLLKHRWQQHQALLRKDCSAYAKLLLYNATKWWTILSMDERHWNILQKNKQGNKWKKLKRKNKKNQQTRTITDRIKNQFEIILNEKNLERSLWKLCDTWITKSSHWCLYSFSQTTYQHINKGPTTVNAVYKGNHDCLDETREAYEYIHYVRP